MGSVQFEKQLVGVALRWPKKCRFPVALVSQILGRLDCKHSFHKRCVKQWFSSGRSLGRCPLCRHTQENQPLPDRERLVENLRDVSLQAITLTPVLSF